LGVAPYRSGEVIEGQRPEDQFIVHDADRTR
jgi:hypothetical protein